MANDRGSRVFLWVALGGGAFFLFVAAIFVLVYISVRADDHAQFTGFGGRIAVVEQARGTVDREVDADREEGRLHGRAGSDRRETGIAWRRAGFDLAL